MLNIINIDQMNGIMLSRVAKHILKFLIVKNRTLVRRLKAENNEPFNFVPRVKGSDGTVSVWGCMSGGARGSLTL